MNHNMQVDRVEKELMAAQGKRYVSLATTANRNNPPFYVGALRQGSGVNVANFIFAAPDMLSEVIARFDGRIDAFLLDTEVKNSLTDMEERAEKLIQKTPIVRIKPNDITVMALDLWIALLVPIIQGVSILVVGAGNIGSKIALVLAERGAMVKLLDQDAAKLDRIVSGLNEIKRGHGSIDTTDENNPAIGSSIILGCTPGVSAVTAAMIKQAGNDCIVIDVGNGTLFPEAIESAHRRGLRVFCLSPEAGFIGWLIALTHATEQINHMKRRIFSNGVSAIGPGMLGTYGEIILDNPDNWNRVLGVCNGKGDVLQYDDASAFIQKFLTQ